MDREAEFRRLYEANRAAVHSYFTGRTGDPQQAADLMQDVFLRVWRRLDKLAGMPQDRQRAWIFTVARNLSVDTHRHERTQTGAERVLARQPGPRGSPGQYRGHRGRTRGGRGRGDKGSSRIAAGDPHHGRRRRDDQR